MILRVVKRIGVSRRDVLLIFAASVMKTVSLGHMLSLMLLPKSTLQIILIMCILQFLMSLRSFVPKISGRVRIGLLFSNLFTTVRKKVAVVVVRTSYITEM